MCKTTTVFMMGILLGTVGYCLAQESQVCPEQTAPEKVALDPVDDVLAQLQAKTSKLTSYEAGIIYRFKQPLLESESLRRGVLHYAKYDQRTFLRIDFQTLKQDQEPEQRYRELYIFDGVWLTVLNYQVKSAKRHQLAEEDKPADAFNLASENLPVIGFTRITDLKREFEVRLVEERNPEKSGLIRLHLRTKPQSKYKDDYTSLDFWMDAKDGLPVKIVAFSPEEEVYEIELVEPKINLGVNRRVFEYNIPRDFGRPEIVPLKKQPPENP
ncbi:MAG TPA: hypothetical protein ENN81_12675 [Phycisphaerales bacterium]|nr:hypothetical protein [Phycisphaerales bacterium]